MSELMALVVGAGGGLVAGWWFLPQPQWAKDMYAKIFGSK